MCTLGFYMQRQLSKPVYSLKKCKHDGAIKTLLCFEHHDQGGIWNLKKVFSEYSHSSQWQLASNECKQFAVMWKAEYGGKSQFRYF